MDGALYRLKKYFWGDSGSSGHRTFRQEPGRSSMESLVGAVALPGKGCGDFFAGETDRRREICRLDDLDE